MTTYSFYHTTKNKIKISPNTLPNRSPQILVITSYPPRECGIATFSHDLLIALERQFKGGFEMVVCALETNHERHDYSQKPLFILNVDDPNAFEQLTSDINLHPRIQMVMVQHEFGFFIHRESELIQMIQSIKKPFIFVFHTVLANPNQAMLEHVQKMVEWSANIVVMTQHSMNILIDDYKAPANKLTVIPHGTHLVESIDREELKIKRHFVHKQIISTFGLLSRGKGIETTINALPSIVEKHPNVLFLILGKTHPTVALHEGETYRLELEKNIKELHLERHVLFVNEYLYLPELLEYLQMTDIYLFTSKDSNQAVSGTFSYAMSCGCPIVTTPFPQAKEILKDQKDVFFDFGNSEQLAAVVNRLLDNERHRKENGMRGLRLMAPTAWPNVAIQYARLFQKIGPTPFVLEYRLPSISLKHVRRMTTSFGMIQFSVLGQPDIHSGYTLDDNARALLAMCQAKKLDHEEVEQEEIWKYYNVIKFCMQPNGTFLNYVNREKLFTSQNNCENLDDSNGRAIWALGYLTSMEGLLPIDLIHDAQFCLQLALAEVSAIYSPRAIAFVIKGLYYQKKSKNLKLMTLLADRLALWYQDQSTSDWLWFEDKMTYGNSVLPEALLLASIATGDMRYRKIAKESFDFLLSKLFVNNEFHVISNNGWMKKNDHQKRTIGGEQPVDVAYTIVALHRFDEIFPSESYRLKIKIAFNWFLGRNHLGRMIYNPCTGGCFDGLEEFEVNLNQGAESTLSYLIARLTIEEMRIKSKNKGHVLRSLFNPFKMKKE